MSKLMMTMLVLVAVAFAAMPVIGQEVAAPAADAAVAPATPAAPAVPTGMKVMLPFKVYGNADDEGEMAFVPSGYMGSNDNGASMEVDDSCTDNPHSGSTCIKVSFPDPRGWAGIAFQNPANNWGGADGGFGAARRGQVRLRLRLHISDALALEALHAAGVHLTYDIVREGLAGVRWPGRFEAFPAPTAGGAPREITLDGAHNPAAAEALAATWREQRRGAPCTLVFSALDDKDVAGILAVLAPLAARIHICPIASQRAMPCPELAALIPAGAPPHAVFDAPAAALAAALAHPEPVLVTGSLFLVGEIRARLTGAVHRPTAQ